MAFTRMYLAQIKILALGMIGLMIVTKVYAKDSDIAQLSIEELMQTEVTSVAKTTQPYADSPAALFVITQEAIRRSGVTNIPEALRMVPGLHVARISSNRWAITARGFNGRFANKLLVLLDGRTVYTPISSGVYWETMDLSLQDIKRIEVIRGPGASLWGANAVNGIINIITENSKDTLGSLSSVTIGNEDKTIIDLRYGDRFGDNLSGRIYGRFSERDGVVDDEGNDAGDDWQLARGGFRADWLASPTSNLMLQGDIYHAALNRNHRIAANTSTGSEVILDEGELSGYSILARWEHNESLASRTTVHFFYQHEQRDELFEKYQLDTADIDIQQELAISGQQDIIWGLGYRYSQDSFNLAEVLAVVPKDRDYELFSMFAQSRSRLLQNRLEITLGSKLEYNSFSGWELQPSIRALWKPDNNNRQRFWAALGRAVRSPARSEQNLFADLFFVPQNTTDTDTDNADTLPNLIQLRGNRNLKSETVNSFEIGYRAWPEDNFYIDIAAFYNRYDDLRFGILESTEVTTNNTFVITPVTITNAEKGVTYGFEIAADWRPTPWWQLQLGYSYLRANFSFKDRFKEAITAPMGLGDERNPRHQLSLRSSFDLSFTSELDIWLRYVDQISDIQGISNQGINPVDNYLTLDLRLSWRPIKNLEVSLSGRNLIDTSHTEFLQEINTFPTQIERSFHGQVTWRF